MRGCRVNSPVMRKGETLSFATTSVDQEGIMLSEISQTEKIKYCLSLMWE